MHEAQRLHPITMSVAMVQGRFSFFMHFPFTFLLMEPCRYQYRILLSNPLPDNLWNNFSHIRDLRNIVKPYTYFSNERDFAIYNSRATINKLLSFFGFNSQKRSRTKDKNKPLTPFQSRQCCNFRTNFCEEKTPLAISKGTGGDVKHSELKFASN